MKGPRELGIGVVYTPKLARVLDLRTVDVLEIEPQMFWRSTGDADEPIRLDRAAFSELQAMPQTKLVHSVSLPVANREPHAAADLLRLRESIEALGSPYASEHLSFNRFTAESPQAWTGFFLPPRQDEHTVQIAAARIDEMRRAVGVPLAFETGVNYLRAQHGEMSDGAFFRRVAEAADCGIVLDLHNLLANERNGRCSIRAVFDELPHERVWEIHLAGGMNYRGYWLDSHSGLIEEDLWAMARAVVDACPNLRAIVFEVMDQYIDELSAEGLSREIERLRALWNARCRRVQVSPGPQPQPQPRIEPQSPRAGRHEQTLGALALGRTPRDPDPHIVADPAAVIYADLVASMREGALYDTVPFLVRLLQASIGPRATLALMANFHAHVLPEQFRAEEARGFLRYVRQHGLSIAHLTEILDFEDAAIAVACGMEQRTVAFDCDPAALLAAVFDWTRAPQLARERFHVDLSRSGLHIRAEAGHSF
jgi:uncharacterized protein (UPF0276 family)/extradiol dioxygenase family protein